MLGVGTLQKEKPSCILHLKKLIWKAKQERKREREREDILYLLLVYSPNGFNSWECTKQKPRSQKFHPVSNVGGRDSFFSHHLLPPRSNRRKMNKKHRWRQDLIPGTMICDAGVPICCAKMPSTYLKFYCGHRYNCLHFVYDCFWAPTAELNSCDYKLKMFTMYPYSKVFQNFGVYMRVLQKVQRK